jgi:hypothetical protein
MEKVIEERIQAAVARAKKNLEDAASAGLDHVEDAANDLIDQLAKFKFPINDVSKLLADGGVIHAHEFGFRAHGGDEEAMGLRINHIASSDVRGVHANVSVNHCPAFYLKEGQYRMTVIVERIGDHPQKGTVDAGMFLIQD